jgi:hypothetical protein
MEVRTVRGHHRHRRPARLRGGRVILRGRTRTVQYLARRIWAAGGSHQPPSYHRSRSNPRVLSMHTVRPVKKVDTVGSLRLSADYVGSLRSPPSVESPLPSTEEKEQKGSGKLRKRSKTETENAGRVLVDQVVLPTLQRVRLSWPSKTAASAKTRESIGDSG